MSSFSKDNEIKILTNHPGQERSSTWQKNTTYFSADRKYDYFSCFKLAIKLYKERKNYDCIVLGAWRSDFIFCILQGVFSIKKSPTILIDCLWYDSGSKLKKIARKFFMRLVDRGVDKYCVWASREIEAYSTAFNIKSDKFVFVPYHTTLDDYSLEARDGDYLFSGGNFQRDYNTLLDAVKALPITLEIGCTRKEIFKNIDVPDNVSVKGYNQLDYMKMMAGCKISIVALDVDHLHSGGQQTILNSMFLGKPTIVTDPLGACDYISNNEDGVLVTPKDPLALRNAIVDLIQNPQKARVMGERAQKKAKENFTTEVHFQKIVDLAREVAKREN